MAPNLQSLRKRRRPFRTLLRALVILGSFLLLLLYMLVFSENGEVIGLGMFAAATLYFLLHYLVWGRALSAEAVGRGESRRGTAVLWPGAEISADARFLPSGEKQTEDGIQCAELSHNLGASRIQQPHNLKQGDVDSRRARLRGDKGTL